jgi:VWFA-related protein
MRLKAPVSVFTASVLLGLASLAGAQGSEARPAPPAAVFSSDVKLVAVPVFVSRDGKAVSGLTVNDFEVEDQGKVVPIAGFLAVDAGASATAQDPTASPGLVAASRRQFLLLFDLAFSSAPGIQKARQAALELIEKSLQPGDLIAVASLGQAGAKVLVGFTSDHTQASRAISTMDGGAEGMRLRDPLGLAYDLGINVAPGAGPGGLEMKERETRAGGDEENDNRARLLQASRADQAAYRQRVASWVLELRKLTELLDSVKGRKQVVLISAGFDDSLLLGAQGTERAESARSVAEGRLWEVQSDRHFGDTSTNSTLGVLFEGVARTDTVIHTVDVGGLAAGGTPDEQGSGVRQASGREGLSQIAGQSGGRFVGGTNDLASALRDVLDTSRYYYVLAFEPSSSKKKPDELRKLKIKVKGSGLQVSHRAGYTLPDPRTMAPGQRQLQAAEAIAKGLSGGAVGLQAVAVPHRNAKGEISLPTVLQIDGESMLAGAGKKPLPIEVYGYVLDGAGHVQDAVALTPTLDLEKLSTVIKDKGIQVLTVFKVKEGPADLRFLVRDPASGRTGSLRMGAIVPPFSSDAFVMSPPILMDDPRARLAIPAPSQLKPQLDIPFRLEDTPFTADAHPILKNGAARDVCVMTFGGGRLAASSLAVTAELVRDGGQPAPVVAGTPRIVEDADRMQRIVFNVTPKGVPAGEYRLRVTIGKPGGGGSAQSELSVRVD